MIFHLLNGTWLNSSVITWTTGTKKKKIINLKKLLSLHKKQQIIIFGVGANQSIEQKELILFTARITYKLSEDTI